MKIKFSTWTWYVRIMKYLAAPIIILDFWRPTWWSPTAIKISFVALVLFMALPGALMALLLRMGKIQFVYSDTDKNKPAYKISKFVAEQEQQNSSVGKIYSSEYYKSFDDSKLDNSSGENTKQK